jgi:hypothetical protein
LALLHLLLAMQATSGVKPSSGVKFTEPLRITPDRPACLGARAFPVLRARIEPWDNVVSARLFFRPQGYPHWYSVPMQRTADDFVGLIPKPRPSARSVVYFIEAEAYRQRTRSLEQTAAVVEDAADCGGTTAPHMETASLVVRVPTGAPPVPPVPPGFEPVGAVGEEGRGHAGRDSLITVGALAVAGGATLALRGDTPVVRTPPDRLINPELTVLDSVPPPESRISLAEGALLSMRVRVRTHQAVVAGFVTVTLYRADEGILRPCGVLQAPHNGFAQGAVNEVLLGGPLQQARACEPSDRVRLVVTQLGQEFLATGRPGIPDATLRYFVSP